MAEPKHKEKLRAVVYARTSSDDPDQSGNGFSGSDRPSIEEQINACKELCQKHGYQLDNRDIFVDMDLSGRMYPEGYSIPDNAVSNYFRLHIRDEGKRYRPDIAKMLDRIGASPVRKGDFDSLSPNKRRIDIIVVRDIFRVCRIPLHAHIGNHFWQIFSALGTQIHSVKDGLIDADEFNDILITELKQRTQEHSQNQQRESSKRSMDAIKNRGGLNTNPERYGFRPGRKQEVEPVTKELEVVKRIFSLFLSEKLNTTEIAVRLNNEGIPTKEANHWRAAHINKLVRLYGNKASSERRKRLSEAEKLLIDSIITRVSACGSDNKLRKQEQRRICREYNENQTSVIDPPIWNSLQVSKILNKPVYSGQNWNTAGKLIQAAAFSTDINKRHPDYAPPISKEDFAKAITIFRGRSSNPGDVSLVSYARWYEKGGRNTRIGTPKYSHKERTLTIHPLSGLLRCWNCAGLLAPHKANENEFFGYKDESGITHHGFSVCYYHCKSFSKAPTPENRTCKNLSILERYPEQSKRPDPYSQGLPLLEALYPLLFRAYIEHVASEQLLTPALIKERKECEEALLEVTKHEQVYFRKFEDKILDPDQFDAVMKEKGLLRQSLHERMTQINKQLDLDNFKELSIDLRALTQPRKMPPELYRALAFRVFKSIVVHPEHIEVFMNTNERMPEEEKSFFLSKICIKRAFRLPWWQAGINTKKITPQSKLTVVYLNKSTLKDIAAPLNRVYQDSMMHVFTAGDNESIVRRAAPKNDELSMKAILQKAFGKVTQQTIISSAFFFSEGEGKPAIFV